MPAIVVNDNVVRIVILIIFGLPITIIDIKRHIISPIYTITFMVIGGAYFLHYRLSYDQGIQLVIVMLITIVYHLILRNNIGGGDLKLFAILGLYFYLDIWLIGVILTGIFGLAIFLFLQIFTDRKIVVAKNKVAFAPAIFVGFFSSAVLAFVVR
jgi:Flp pilus assembly protein protease CpaA